MFYNCDDDDDEEDEEEEEEEEEEGGGGNFTKSIRQSTRKKMSGTAS